MMTRREAMVGLAFATSGLLLGCNTDPFGRQKNRPRQVASDHTFRTFIKTIIPGAPIDHPNITITFTDPYFALSRYRQLLVMDLRRRSARLWGSKNFEKLALVKRIAVIENGLQSKQVGKLYSGMIYAIQITVFSGFYKQQESCRLIDFTAVCDPEPGSTTYPDAKRFLGRSLSRNGNYA